MQSPFPLESPSKEERNTAQTNISKEIEDIQRLREPYQDGNEDFQVHDNRIIDAIYQLRHSIDPLVRLPSELWTCILLEALRQYSNEYLDISTHDLLSLTLVSRRWCALIMDAPILWSYIHLDDKPGEGQDTPVLISTFLHLSRTCPLYLTFHLPLPSWSNIRDEVFNHRSRIRAVDFDIKTHVNAGVLSALEFLSPLSHLTRLRVPFPVPHRLLEKYMAGILGVCKKLTTLSLYYFEAGTEVVRIGAEVQNLLEEQQLSELSICSIPVLKDLYYGNMPIPPGPLTLLESISSSKKCAEALKVLKVVTETIPHTTYDLIHSNLTSLQSLKFDYSLGRGLRLIRGPEERSKWSLNPHLTKLELINCRSAYAPHVPLLVHHFPSLKELIMSTCGDYSDIPTPPNPPGWSRKPEALCNLRPPLDTFHMDHLSDWELTTLGVIPTKVLIVTLVKQHDLSGCLTEDANLFPGMKILRVTPKISEEVDNQHSSSFTCKIPPSELEMLENICKEREIELRRDAPAIRDCFCCRY